MGVSCLPEDFYVYVAVFTVHIGGFISATTMAWTSIAISKLLTLEDNPLGVVITSTQKSILGSSPIIGKLIGIYCSAYLTKKFGRRPLLILLGIPVLISFILMAFSTNVWQLYVGRVIGGLSFGGVAMVGPVYSAEVAKKSRRGFLGTAACCFLNLGILFATIAGPLTSFFWYNITLGAFPALYIVLAYMLVPETPYYLVKTDYEKAVESLRKLRGTNDVKDELNYIKASLEKETHVRLRDVLHNKGLRKGLIIGCGLFVFHQITGFSAVIAYSQQIFDESGGLISKELGPVIIAAVQFVVCFLAPLLIDKSGRKILLSISHFGMALSELALGIYFIIQRDGKSVAGISWLPIASLAMYIITLQIGSGPIPPMMLGELFPSEVKEVATSVVITVNCVLIATLLTAFNVLTDLIGMGAIFLLFSGSGFLSLLFIKFCVVETKGKSLKEIQDILNGQGAKLLKETPNNSLEENSAIDNTIFKT